MKLKVWSEQCKNDTDESQFYLRLTEERMGILLSFCDKMGERIENGSVLDFNSHYRCIVAMAGLNQNVPIKLDAFDHPLIITELDIQKAKSSQIVINNTTAKFAEDATVDVTYKPTYN